ncbi:DUF58 domain-containing protein [Tamlana sp. s12]|uniref:DUF58 domain-containing protein n=1 Tax=Tamlana sp. s12 TaxID=1630406 RepID=UPI0007FC6FE2|nr:DUF58 domain-containing protein [Tamlana sp. s12]OBQ55136.1 hypothetical protein VQ01_10450 [Tamlana sp. s12]QQY83248.1 DUF58 domain-containing protein [Tamlana sp. s12]
MLQNELNKAEGFKNLELLAKQVVEGFIAGMHKSPFHGFSAEFAEHKIYNQGESTRHIDWKLFAKTEKLYTKRYDDETNLRCHMIIDSSSSMHYPKRQSFSIDHLNKIGFSVLAAAALMQILKKQRDAVGLSVYSDQYDYYAPEKGSERHHQMLLSALSEVAISNLEKKQTDTYKYLHEIAEKIHKRSMIFLFTDMFQASEDDSKMFEALRHLKYNKHEVVLFHVMDKKKELEFDFNNTPKRFVDVETGEYINLYADAVKESYRDTVEKYFTNLRLKCGQYKIKYVEADINADFNQILTTYLIERQKFS